MRNKKKQKGFTLIELLVVVSIIGLLASIAMVGLNRARLKARDVRRISGMVQIRNALELYYSIYGSYPNGPSDGCIGGWDSSADGQFIHELTTAGLLREDFLDPVLDGNNSNCGNFQYNVYNAGQYGCNASKGKFYVLDIIDLESVTVGDWPDSPGFSCPLANWGDWPEWATGGYEK